MGSNPTLSATVVRADVTVEAALAQRRLGKLRRFGVEIAELNRLQRVRACLDRVR